MNEERRVCRHKAILQRRLRASQRGEGQADLWLWILWLRSVVAGASWWMVMETVDNCSVKEVGVKRSVTRTVRKGVLLKRHECPCAAERVSGHKRRAFTGSEN